MEEKIKYQFPILTINEVKPLLQKDQRVFAHAIKATTKNGGILTLYENKGLNLSDYIGKKVECLLEITKGKFEYKDEAGKPPENTIAFWYRWQKRSFEFFPELIKIRDDLQKVNATEEESMLEVFETTAAKLFKDWGLNGLDIEIYQTKPLLNSPDGFFLLNEYQFEEEIEDLELDEEVYIKIDELFLRGVRPVK